MKIKTDAKKGFEPFDITITLETEQEVYNLLHFFNAPTSVVRGHQVSGVPEFSNTGQGDFIYNLFDAVDEAAKARGLR